MTFPGAITDEPDLRSRYRPQSDLVHRKEIDHIDAGARQFIERSPFVVLATSGPGGCDASPRGGPPGFVAVLDEHHLAIGDLSGNNRLDSYCNVVASPAVGLLFMVPGVEETLRVNGRATLTIDDAILDAAAIDGRRPRVALGVDVDACYIHCGKALRRGGLWEPERWLPVDQRPSPACILREHVQLDVEPDVIERALEKDYRATLWEAGGSADGGA
jgi:PPOX class probable FMN-dependent enzyme